MMRVLFLLVTFSYFYLSIKRFLSVPSHPDRNDFIAHKKVTGQFTRRKNNGKDELIGLK